MREALLWAGGLGLAAVSANNYRYYKKKGNFWEFQGIFAALEPENLELYSSLLPAPMQMPEMAAVSLFVVDYLSVGPWPLTRYLEGSVALRCKYDGVEGWHVKTMPVDKIVSCRAGRMLGYPKYVADEITLRENGDGWFGEVRHQGRAMISIQYRQGFEREPIPWEEEMVEAGSLHMEEPIYLLVPPDKGPRFQMVTLKRMIPDQWETEVGMARVSIDESEPWAGLITQGADTPAFFQRFTGGAIMKPKKLA
jgi:hypothetical protein